MNIVVRHATKKYRIQTALDDVSCDFPSRQIHGIIGRNGSGKTVLLRSLCGYTKLSSGEILIDGKKLGQDMEFPQSMGILIDSPSFIPRFAAKENLQLLMNISKRSKEDKAMRIKQAIIQVGLEEQSRKRVSQYSLGMKQRLGIAQAIMEQPDLLILDEPFNGLDRDGVKSIQELLLKERERGATILLTSHYPDDLAAICDTITHLDGGHITWHKTYPHVNESFC